MKKTAVVIGSGFSGLSASCYLAAQNFDVLLLEKNATPGGRGRNFSEKGYTFDMGPSWYWMPDIFDNFFAYFGKKTSDYYQLHRLDPGYSVFFGKKDVVNIPAGIEQTAQLFESIEAGAGEQLKRFLADAKIKYDIGINEFVQKPGLSFTELLQPSMLVKATKLHLFQSFRKYAQRYFKHPKLLQMIEFPVLFLGATPTDTPALYSLMNYADLGLGTWYPMGGMYSVVEAMVQLAQSLGVKIQYNTTVQGIDIEKGIVTNIRTSQGNYNADVLIPTADYEHVEQHLIPEYYRNYSPKYWQKRKMAPSALLYYLGINKPLSGLEHHNLIFDRPFDQHAHQIYKQPQWPSEPLLYVSCTSKTDASVAPAGHENMVILIPVAPNLDDTPEVRQRYLDISLQRLEFITEQSIAVHVDYSRSYAHNDFINDYNAFGGNAYGLANTLMQTHIFKPSMMLKGVKNLFFAGQLTVPGPGVPPSIISGQVAAAQAVKRIK